MMWKPSVNAICSRAGRSWEGSGITPGSSRAEAQPDPTRPHGFLLFFAQKPGPSLRILAEERKGLPLLPEQLPHPGELLRDALGGRAPMGAPGFGTAARVQPLQGLGPEGRVGRPKVLERGPGEVPALGAQAPHQPP